MLAAATSRRPSKTNGSAAAAATPNQTIGGSSQPRDERERGDAREAAQQIDRVGPQRRPAGQLAAHALRHGDEQRGHGREEQRQQQRALDRHDRLRGAAREIDRRRARDGDLEPQAVDRDDHRELNQREPGEQIAPARRRADSRRRCRESSRAG